MSLPADGVPACWTWEITQEDREAVFRAGIIAIDEDDLWAAERLVKVLSDWQRGRCALCGYPKERLIYDHDHIDGLLRGRLCGACNNQEGQSLSPVRSTPNEPVLDRYRALPPAVLLGIRIPWQQGSGPGMPSAAQQMRWTDSQERRELQRFVAEGGPAKALLRHARETDPVLRNA